MQNKKYVIREKEYITKALPILRFVKAQYIKSTLTDVSLSSEASRTAGIST